MRTTTTYAAMCCLFSVVGCSSTDGGRGGPGAGGATGAGATGGTSGTVAGSGGASGVGAGGSPVAGSGSAGGTSAGAGGLAAGAGGSQAGSGGATGECGAAGGGGGAPLLQCGQLGGTCGGCISSNACDIFEFGCAVNADCVCMAKCIGTASLSGVGGCLGTCGLTGSPPGFADLAEVVARMCPDGDECSAPPSFTPPPDTEPPGPVSNAGTGSGAFPDCSFDSGLPYDPNGAVLQLQSADGKICVRLERRDDGPGSNANTSWTLLDVLVGPPGEVAHIEDPSAVCWYSSHHNFNDWAHAWSGSRHYDVRIALTGHGATPTYRLYVFEAAALAGGGCAPLADGSCPIGSPIELVPFP